MKFTRAAKAEVTFAAGVQVLKANNLPGGRLFYTEDGAAALSIRRGNV